VDVLGLTIMIPLLPFYAERFGASPAMVGWLIGVYAACQLVSGPLLGRASDFTGRKPLLIVSQIGTLIGFLMLAFAPNLWIIFLARVVDGATAGNLSLAQAYISDVTEPEQRSKAFGLIGIAFGMGFLIGPAISGYLAQFGFRDPIFAAAGLSALSILATTLLPPGAKPGDRSAEGTADGPAGRRLTLFQWGEYGKYFRDPHLSLRLWQFLAFALSFAMFVGGFALFAERRLTWHGHPFTTREVGYTWAYAGFLGIFLQGPPLWKMVDRFGDRALNRVGYAAYAAGYALMAYAFSIPVLMVATTVSTVGSLVRPTLTSLITQAAPRREQGVVLGLTQSLTSVAQIIAPPLAGWMIQREWLSGWGLAAAGFAMVGFALSYSKRGIDRRSAEKAASM